MSYKINSLTTLIDEIIANNIETIEEYGIDLHNENLQVIAINPSTYGDRNTAVTVKADGPRVKMENTYFYNRQDLGGLLSEVIIEVPADELPTSKDELLALINLPEFESIPEDEWHFTIHPSMLTIRVSDSLGWFGSHCIRITGDEETHIDLAAFDQTVLGGFEQDAP